MDFPKPRSQYLSDETHFTIRTAIVLAALLLFIGWAFKACKDDLARHSNAPLIETCVTHPATKRVVVQ